MKAVPLKACHIIIWPMSAAMNSDASRDARQKIQQEKHRTLIKTKNGSSWDTLP